MKILITGISGQLGREFYLNFRQAGIPAIGITRQDIDFLEPDKIEEKISSYKADWIINCAAYTAVDKAESENKNAFLINRDSARAIAMGAIASRAKLLHISTDFVFSGYQSQPYSEEDEPCPQGVYGISKYEGEMAIQEVYPEAAILRTSWVYGEHGNNFVKTILRLAGDRAELGIVDDQIGTPTWTKDIVNAGIQLLNQSAQGIYHFSNEGVASWYDFAHAIVKNARIYNMDLKINSINPIPTVSYPTPAVRPKYSVLSKRKIRGVLGYSIPHWRDSLDEMMKSLLLKQ